ncbi:MAG TPA: hypothetical protein VHT34_12215 [Clostridia bacterium]|nr:hypothetical protein [Clostridia bacterium]
MNALVIIPSLQHKYSFSAPLAWLFSHHASKVRGIYSESLRPHDLSGIDLCIVELNWFIELCEFGHIVNYIRKYGKGVKILFGGLFAQLKYREIFKRYDVDLYIKGFAELPMKLLLDGKNPCDIPNMVGRDFESETTYYPTKEDLENITYNLDWFPDYFRLWSLYPAYGVDAPLSSSLMPFRPSYKYPKKIKNPLKEYRVPPSGGRYHLPMVITSRGGCKAVHEGCSYCMGSKKDELREIYKCDGVALDNDTLKKHLRQISERFEQATIYINTPFEYDFTGEHYNLEVTIEVDCPVNFEQLGKIIYAFPKAKVNLVLYKEGHTCDSGKKKYADVKNLLKLEDENHRIYFFAFRDDAEEAGIPLRNRLYSEFAFPKWTNWEYYTDWNKALRHSKKWFAYTRQYNLLPPPQRIIMRTAVNFTFLIIFLMTKLGLKRNKENMLFGDKI